jgi:hypothetical protein
MIRTLIMEIISMWISLLHFVHTLRGAPERISDALSLILYLVQAFLP